jgi:nucleoside-diphosphate-sugar epimerase
MYAITGITGRVGGALARTLLAASQPVRSVVRDTTRGLPWAECGWEETRSMQRRLVPLRRRESNCARPSAESGNVPWSGGVGSWLICMDPPDTHRWPVQP